MAAVAVFCRGFKGAAQIGGFMFKRGKIYYTNVRGRRESLGTSTKSEAKRLEEKWRNEVFERRNGFYVPTYLEAAQNWLDQHQHLTGYAMMGQMARWWEPYFADVKCTEITPEEVHRIIKAKRPIDETNKVPANVTANRFVDFLAKIIRHGCKIKPEFRRYPVAKGRKRWLRPEQWQELQGHCPDDFRQLATFALATGLREANVMRFEWAWLHGDKAYIPAAVTKTEEDYGIPLNRTAQAILEERRKAPIRHQKYVFLRGGEMWHAVAVHRAMKRACRASGVDYLPFHGLRHTFASWLAQKGVSDSVRRRLGCWSTGQGASELYAHFDVEALRPFSYMLDEILQKHYPNPSQAELKSLIA